MIPCVFSLKRKHTGSCIIMQNSRIATVVRADNLRDFFNDLAKIQRVADLIELRVDYIQGLQVEHLKELKAKTEKPAILTCRKKAEGGGFAGSEKQRLAIIQKAIDLKFPYVDVELSTFKKYKLNKIRGVKLIVSYHNFEKTPSYNFLEKIVGQCYKLGADIAKVAVKANSFKDSKTILQLVLNKKPNKEIIALAMGEKGKITRVVSPLLGAYLTFASVGGRGSAPGQIDIKGLKAIYQVMGF